MLSLSLARGRRRIPSATLSRCSPLPAVPGPSSCPPAAFTAALPASSAAEGSRGFLSLAPRKHRAARARSLLPAITSLSASAATTACSSSSFSHPSLAAPLPPSRAPLVAVGAGLRPSVLPSPLTFQPGRGHAGHSHSPASPAAAAAEAAAQAQAQARSGLSHAEAQVLDSRITRVGLYSNIGLTIVKAAAGILGNSVALVADALHGLSDMVTDAVTLLTIKHASAPADRDHPYGHGRIEDVGTLAVSAIVVATGLGIGWHSAEKMVELAVAPGGILHELALNTAAGAAPGEGAWAGAVRTVESALLDAVGGGAKGAHGGHGHGHGHSLMEVPHTHAHGGAPPEATASAGSLAAAGPTSAEALAALDAAADEAPVPSVIALAVALASVGIKEALFHATRRVSARTGSRIVEINAWHHRSDAASSMIAVVGVAGAMMRWPILDPLAGLAVAGMIAKQGWDMGVEVYHDITEKQLPADLLAQLRAEAARCQPYGALAVYGLRGRKMGRDIAVDLTVVVPGHFGVAEARGVAELVRGRLLGLGLGVSEVMVAVDEEGSESAKAGVAAAEAEAEAEAAAEAASGAEARKEGEHSHSHSHSHTHTHEHTEPFAACGEDSAASAPIPFPSNLRMLRSQAALEADIAAVVAAPAFAGKGLRLGDVTSRYEGGEVAATIEILLEPAAAAPAAPAAASASASVGAPTKTGTRPCLPFVPTSFRPPAADEAEGAALLRLRPVLTGLCGVHGVAAELQRALVEKVEGLDKAVVVLRLAG